MNKYLIAPSILSADFLRLKESLAACETAGADWIHVDVMDGNFVPNITMGPFLVGTFKRATRLPLDVHLMIQQPERYLEAFAKAGASHLTVHVETCPRLTVSKVAQIRKKLDEIHSCAYLEVDGGISADTLPVMKNAGADAFVSATAVFKHPEGIEAGVNALRALLQ